VKKSLPAKNGEYPWFLGNLGVDSTL